MRNKSKKGKDQCQPNEHEERVSALSYSHVKAIDATSDVTKPVNSRKRLTWADHLRQIGSRKAKTKVAKGQGDRGDTKRGGSVVRRLVRKLTGELSIDSRSLGFRLGGLESNDEGNRDGYTGAHFSAIHLVCLNKPFRSGLRTKRHNSALPSPITLSSPSRRSILVLLAIVGLIFRNDPAGAWNKITEQMSYFLDKSAVEVVQNIAQKAAQPSKGLLATIIGIALALFGASGVFGQLQDALNTIWGVKAKPGGGIWGFLRVRFLSFAMVGGVCFLLLVSLTLESVLKGFSHLYPSRIAGRHRDRYGCLLDF